MLESECGKKRKKKRLAKGEKREKKIRAPTAWMLGLKAINNDPDVYRIPTSKETIAYTKRLGEEALKNL